MKKSGILLFSLIAIIVFSFAASEAADEANPFTSQSSSTSEQPNPFLDPPPSDSEPFNPFELPYDSSEQPNPFALPQSHEHEETAPAAPVEAGKSPKIIFDMLQHDFGVLGKQESVKHNFKFKNEGEGKLIIDEVKATCGCTGTLLTKKELAPGEEGEIEVTFRSGSSGGKKKKSIYVRSNDPNSPSVQLRILAEVILPVEIRPRSLYWVAQKNHESMRSAMLLYQPEVSINITGFEFSSPAFSATTTPTMQNDKPAYDIEIKYDGSNIAGSFKETMTVLTDNPEHQRITVSLRGKVVGAIRLSPDAVALGVVKEGILPSRMVRIAATKGVDFEILSTESSSPLISAEYTRKESSTLYEMTVTLTDTPPKGAFSEKIVIKTSVPDESVIELPVYAFVK